MCYSRAEISHWLITVGERATVKLSPKGLTVLIADWPPINPRNSQKRGKKLHLFVSFSPWEQCNCLRIRYFIQYIREVREKGSHLLVTSRQEHCNIAKYDNHTIVNSFILRAHCTLVITQIAAITLVIGNRCVHEISAFFYLDIPCKQFFHIWNELFSQIWKLKDKS